MWAGALCSPCIPWGQHAMSLLQQDVWFSGARSSAAHLFLPQSSCRKLDAREQTITFFSQETASCLYKAGYMAFASKMHTNLFFPGGWKPSFPHLPSMCLEREILSLPPSHSSSGCFSVSPLILLESKSQSLVCVLRKEGAKANNSYEKGGKGCSHPQDMGRREQLFPLWKQKFCREAIHENRTFMFSFYRKFFPKL